MENTREQNLRLVSQFTEEQAATVVPMMTALMDKDYWDLERLYRNEFSGEALDRLLEDLEQRKRTWWHEFLNDNPEIREMLLRLRRAGVDVNAELEKVAQRHGIRLEVLV